MSHVISVGQTYRHQDGDEYEVVKAERDSVIFETSRGSIVCMEVDELISDLNECVLLPVVDIDGDGEEEDEDEDGDSGD